MLGGRTPGPTAAARGRRRRVPLLRRVLPCGLPLSLLPDGTAGAGGRPGPGDIRPGLAVPRSVRPARLAARLAAPDRPSRVPALAAARRTRLAGGDRGGRGAGGDGVHRRRGAV